MITIGRKKIGPGYPVFVIAEIGINHNGSLDIAKGLIDVAVEAGCDAVKFQKRTVEVVYSEEERSQPRAFDTSILQNAMSRRQIEHVKYPVFPSDSLARLEQNANGTTNGDLKFALEFGTKEYDIIDRYCREKGIYWFASCWDGLSAHFINGFNLPCHKVASACLTNRDLLQRVRYNGKPIIISTGGSTLEQVIAAVAVLGREDLAILHCVATYPSTDEEANIAVIDTLQRVFPGVPIGYSGHEVDSLPTLMAVARGACLVERHITLARSMPGSDHKASLEPQELKELVRQIRRIEAIMGDGVKRVLPKEEQTMKKLRRVNDLVAL